ncbi:hypothetical protein E4U12_007385 [Claviceps purpurea]|nr:hypothetical protein E4U12_007385 [Claviceps purpurea]
MPSPESQAHVLIQGKQNMELMPMTKGAGLGAFPHPHTQQIHWQLALAILEGTAASNVQNQAQALATYYKTKHSLRQLSINLINPSDEL